MIDATIMINIIDTLFMIKYRQDYRKKTRFRLGFFSKRWSLIFGPYK